MRRAISSIVPVRSWMPLERLLGVPAGEVGDALAAGVEAGAGADDAGDALDDQLRLGAAEALVVDPVRVRELVHERRHLPVRRERGVDDDACVAGGAVAGAAVERLVADREAERGGVRFERSEQVLRGCRR